MAKKIKDAKPEKKAKVKKPSSEQENQVTDTGETAAQKYQREVREEEERKSREDRASRQLHHMKRRDIVRESILRGLPFDQAAMSTPSLCGWFTNNLDNGQDATRLTEYDIWREQQTGEKLHPDLKFGGRSNVGDFSDKELRDSTKPQRAKKEKGPDDDKPKVKKEKDEKNNIFKGTKKALTFELSQSGKPIKEIIEKVMETFPDANEKSIKIWAKRALK